MMSREQVAQKLFDYFDFNTKDGTCVYNLTRVKEAFNFEEIDEEFIYDLADFILNNIETD